MASYRVESNLKTLGPKMNKIFDRFPTEMDFRTGKAAKRTQILLFRKTPKDTGTAARGWFVRKLRLFFYLVDNKSKHIDAIEFGTGVHATKGPRRRIRAKKGKFLIFPVRNKKYNLRTTDFGGGPEFYITKSVKGQKPQFIVKNAARLINKILNQEILKGINKIVDAFNRLK